MAKNGQKFLIYGRNFHARAAFRKLNSAADGSDVIGFVEQKEEIGQQDFLGKPIFPISKLRDLDFDRVVIAGRYLQEMKDAILQSGVNAEKIWAMKRSEFQPPAAELQQRSAATLANLEPLLDLINQNSVEHWFLASSLLALKRGQDLAWFADVDIAVPAEQLEGLAEAIKASNLFHVFEIRQHKSNGLFWRAGNIYQIVIRSGQELMQFEPAVIDIHALHRHDDQAYYNLTENNFLKVSNAHFVSHSTMPYGNLNLNIPLEEVSYLKATYGDNWAVPAELFNNHDHVGRVHL